LQGEALVETSQKEGYVLLMRHASSPGEVPDKQTANSDNRPPASNWLFGAYDFSTVPTLGSEKNPLNS
jgi:hypothetical protein